MDDLRFAYHALLCSAPQMALCRQAGSLADLLGVLRRLWSADHHSDMDLLRTLAALNRESVPEEVAACMAGLWLPRSYDVRSQRVQWCLPDGPPTEPFHDEYLSRCWHSATVNQLITPRSSLQALAACMGRVSRAQPAGFILHLSRCGSTLLSGCLSELDEAAVFSESPVLTELLIDPALSPEEKRSHLTCLIDLKASLFPGRRVVIKWNAWDIFHIQLLRDAYPTVPIVALVRDPVEILASHQALAGRHMSGDPSLATVAPVFGASASHSLLEHRIRVLEAMMNGMLTLRTVPGIVHLDYRQLDIEAVERVAKMFDLHFGEEGRHRMAQRMQRNAKLPGSFFQPDGHAKAAVFGKAEAAAIAARTSLLHQALVPQMA